MLPFPPQISLEQKYTHHVVDVHDVRSLQQFLPYEYMFIWLNYLRTKILDETMEELL